MRLPISWLKDYVDISGYTPEQIADKLLSTGFEVEEIIYDGKGIENVVVGKVLEMERHQNSDKLWICKVDVRDNVLTIVTGAQNVSVGDFVPVALVGATVAGKSISKSNLRGIDSYGMLCSGKELNIDDDVIEGASVDGILILKNLENRLGDDIKDVLPLNDCVLDIAVTANRPDCQAVANMAREVAILLNRKYKAPSYKYKTVQSTEPLPKVTIVERDLCSRYIGRRIKDIKIERSPDFMRHRLRMCNVRPINNIVDITNYVLLEIGSPLHAFDVRYIDNEVVVRKGNVGEKITALNDCEYDVNGVLVIADKSKPLAIAGIMGGEYTSIFGDTKTVFLEAARFERSNIRRTSRAIGLRTDSSARFEKGVDFLCAEKGSNRALHLIDALKCGKIEDAVTVDTVSQPEQKVIKTSCSQICSVLGIDVPPAEVKRILKNQDISIQSKGNELICTIPLYREDIDNFTDLAEEVIRFYGYDKLVESRMINAHVTQGGLNTKDKNIRDIKNVLVSYGAYECLSYSFINENDIDKLNVPSDSYMRSQIPILNPLNKELAVMRTQLVTSMLSTLALNRQRKNGDNYRLFELARVFLPQSLPLDKMPNERDTLCIAFSGKQEDFYTIKEVSNAISNLLGVAFNYERSCLPFLYPMISADIITEGKNIGFIGKVHPTVCESFELANNVYICQIDLADLLERETPVRAFAPLAKFPPVERDLAVITEQDISAKKHIDIIKETADLLESVRLFDEYSGSQILQGKKSLAFSLVFRASDHTLTDSEINEQMALIMKALETQLGATLR